MSASQEYAIPQSLWDSLDAVLYTKGLTLAKEIAKELNTSPLPLIDLLKAADRSKFTLIPDNEVSKYQCQALIHCGSTMMRCRCPSFKANPSLCLAHEKYTPDHPTGMPLVQRLVTTEATYMVNGSDVFTLNGQQCGFYKNTRLTLFEVVD
jgi:hypothetical protein